MNTIDAKVLKRSFLTAAQSLDAKKDLINELNVFPVPDGDTGTNMTMTIMAAAREVAALEEPDMESLAKAISSGSLRGARGNSGVILSQLFRGFAKEIRTTDVITTTTLANALVRGSETAYKAVMKPKEGTILTVARGMSEKAVELVTETEDIIEFLKKIIEQGDYVLSQTPEMLPILKQAGVVDSGGQGLMEVMKGLLDGLMGKEADLSAGDSTVGRKGTASAAARVGKGTAGVDTANIDTANIRYGYCTEFIINVEKEYSGEEERKFKDYLESIGDSIVVVSDDDVVKVHVHTNDPGLAIQRALTYGSLSKMKIDNMREEHHERLIKDAQRLASEQAEREKENRNAAGRGAEGQRPGAQSAGGQNAGEQKPDAQSDGGRNAGGQNAGGQNTGTQEFQNQAAAEEPRKPYGFIAVSVGKGFEEILKGIGADYLIEGGQTMNPSAEDILNAIDRVNADTVFILPNNGNIILAAEQAARLTKDKKVVVVPSKSVPQGISALISFGPELSLEENQENMANEMAHVKTGQITYAVRSTILNGKEIKEGDIMGIMGKDIVSVGDSVRNTALETLKTMVDKDSELVSIYYGEKVEEAEANGFLEMARGVCPDCEVELHFGGQPIYYYLMSVE